MMLVVLFSYRVPPGSGLDNSGKSTLLHRLSQGQVTALQPTERPHIDEFQLGGVSFKVCGSIRRVVHVLDADP